MSSSPALDQEVVDAINTAVREMQQPAVVGRRLLAWINEASRGQAKREDDERRFDDLRSAIRLTPTEETSTEDQESHEG